MKALKIFFILNILLCFSACDKGEDNKYLYGNIVGFVEIKDCSGEIPENKSGVKVSIENLSYSDITNEIGRFEIKDAPAGTFNIAFSKNGYGTNKKLIQFIGGAVPHLISETTIYEIPEVELQSIDISFSDNEIHINGQLSSLDPVCFKIYINDSTNVSDLNYDYSTFKYWLNTNGLVHSQLVHSIDLSYTPYELNDKIYLVIYFSNPYGDPSSIKASDILSLSLI